MTKICPKFNFDKWYKKGNQVGVIFSGGPAPGANAVISTIALTFLSCKIKVIGIIGGYENIQKYDKNSPFQPEEDKHYVYLKNDDFAIRNRSGVILGTSRAHPGMVIKSPEDLKNPEKTRLLRNVMDAFENLGVGVLVSIGGDGTLMTANYLNQLGLPVIHVPKTIDNDYNGISWTFGYWTVVSAAQRLLKNLRQDALATKSYFVVELMGRNAGWIAYGAGVAGEAVASLAPEDIDGELDLDGVGSYLAETIIKREKEENKGYGVICIAEGLADKLPKSMKPEIRDRHGNICLSAAKVAERIAESTKEHYQKLTGKEKKITPLSIGYEIRNADPVAFDVVMGSMLGYGAFKLIHEEKYGHMVSVTDNFDIRAIPFQELIDSKTLRTINRTVSQGSDFYRLKELLSWKSVVQDDLCEMARKISKSQDSKDPKRKKNEG